MSIPKKYRTINFRPPQIIADMATKGLAFRRQFKRGGTPVGIARARDLKNRRTISPETIKRMVSYFARHEVDKRSLDFGNDIGPSTGYIAWLLWGGEPGKEWAQNIKRQMTGYDK
jgi:hypothetical protein